MLRVTVVGLDETGLERNLISYVNLEEISPVGWIDPVEPSEYDPLMVNIIHIKYELA